MKDEDDLYAENTMTTSRNISGSIWGVVKYFLAILNALAAAASIFGVLFSVLTDVKLAVVFHIVIIILTASIFLAIMATYRSNKNDKMKEVSKYAQGFHEILHLIRDCYADLLEFASVR